MTKPPSRASSVPAAAPITQASKGKRKAAASKASKTSAKSPQVPALPATSQASTPETVVAPAAAERGRPTVYTQANADEILRRIANGESLKRICESSPHLPPASTVREWAIDDRHDFAARSARAYAMGYEAVAEETIEIADETSQDWIEKRNMDGSTYMAFNAEHVQRAKVRIDTRLRLLAKWSPKRYGDKLELAGSVQLTMAEQLKAINDQKVPPHAAMPPGADV